MVPRNPFWFCPISRNVCASASASVSENLRKSFFCHFCHFGHLNHFWSSIIWRNQTRLIVIFSPFVPPFVPPLRAIQPGLRPSQPGLKPSQPGLEPSQPGLRPNQPGLRPASQALVPTSHASGPTSKAQIACLGPFNQVWKSIMNNLALKVLNFWNWGLMLSCVRSCYRG